MGMIVGTVATGAMATKAGGPWPATPFSQALRDRFDVWSRGDAEITCDDVAVLQRDPSLAGPDAAVLAVLRPLMERLGDLPMRFGLRRSVVTRETLDEWDRLAARGDQKLVAGAEKRYQDCLQRLETPRTLFTGGGPSASAVRQGSHPNCVLTSTLIALAHQRPHDVEKLVRQEGGDFVLRLPGRGEKRVAMPRDLDVITQSCGYKSGLWTTVICQELGDVGQMRQPRAIRRLTGNAVNGDMLMFTSDATTRRRLTEALDDHRVVIAGRSAMAPTVKGLQTLHCFAVLDFDPKTDLVSLQDPGGMEPLDEAGNPLDGKLDGQFTLPLPSFTRWFSRVYYEQAPPQR